jgi:hypothetical protein
MSDTLLSRSNAPVGSEILIRKITLREKHYSTSTAGNPFPYERVYGDIESAKVLQWTPKGFVKLAFAHRDLWVDSATYELCEVL